MRGTPGSTGAWIGRSGLAATLVLVPFSDLVLPGACSPGQDCWPSVAPAAFVAISAAVIMVLSSAGSLGCHVYDELLRDVRERTRANGWVEDQAVVVPADDADQPRESVIHDDMRVKEEAERTLAAELEEALAQARIDAERQREVAVRDTRTAFEAELARVKQEARAAAAAEVARVNQEAERTLAVKLEEARSEITAVAEGRTTVLKTEAAARKAAELKLAQALEQARADAAAAAAELARVKQEAEQTLAVRLDLKTEAAARKAAELKLAQALEQARADADRERDAAAAELARVKQEITTAARGRIAVLRKAAETKLAQAVEQARADAERERDAAVREATSALEAELDRVTQAAATAKAADPDVPPALTVDLVSPAQESTATRKQTLEEHIAEARAQLARHNEEARRAQAAR